MAAKSSIYDVNRITSSEGRDYGAVDYMAPEIFNT